jgi:hypothetical protein
MEGTMVLTAGLAVLVAGYSWKAIAIVAPPGLARSRGTVTVPHRAPLSVPTGQDAYTAVGPDAAAPVGGVHDKRDAAARTDAPEAGAAQAPDCATLKKALTMRTATARAHRPADIRLTMMAPT